MSTRIVRFAFLALPTAALVACEQPITPELSPEVQPALGIANAPAEAGIVTRDDRAVAATWVDSETGMRAFIGVDIVEFCNGGGAFDVEAIQTATLRDGRVVGLVQGADKTTSVWGFPQFSCAMYTSEEPLATGLSVRVGTDNDFDGVFVSGTNAFGFAAHGPLTRPNGARAQFSGHLRFTTDAEGSTRILSSKVSLR